MAKARTQHGCAKGQDKDPPHQAEEAKIGGHMLHDAYKLYKQELS